MNRFVIGLLLCVAGMVHAEDFAAKRAKVLALGKLTTAPAMMDAEGFRNDDSVRAIYFDALDYEGKPTKVFAWLGLPKEATPARCRALCWFTAAVARRFVSGLSRSGTKRVSPLSPSPMKARSSGARRKRKWAKAQVAWPLAKRSLPGLRAATEGPMDVSRRGRYDPGQLAAAIPAGGGRRRRLESWASRGAASSPAP